MDSEEDVVAFAIEPESRWAPHRAVLPMVSRGAIVQPWRHRGGARGWAAMLYINDAVLRPGVESTSAYLNSKTSSMTSQRLSIMLAGKMITKCNVTDRYDGSIYLQLLFSDGSQLVLDESGNDNWLTFVKRQS
jgi:hypothetical protein